MAPWRGSTEAKAPVGSMATVRVMAKMSTIDHRPTRSVSRY